MVGRGESFFEIKGGGGRTSPYITGPVVKEKGG